MRLSIAVRLFLLLVLALPILGTSTVPPADRVEQIRTFTRSLEFDYVQWILDALLYKTSQSALGAVTHLPAEVRVEVVQEYLQLVQRQKDLIYRVTQIYADPNITDHQAISRLLREELAQVTDRLDRITPLAESILQAQIGQVIVEMGLSVAGQPIPPVWYHSTSVPLGLIVSPRNIIQQTANLSIDPNLNIDQIIELEGEVSSNLNVSAYVSPIGGIGVYPTMVYKTSNLSALAETIAHEWIHNYLTLRPLGVLYDASPELRTMNETTASIAGNEISQALLERYYPEAAPKANASPIPRKENEVDKPVFSFNGEMHTIRVHVDALLAEGKIEEAELFMEESRELFLENGYLVRKLNQAYFAFHGAYSDQPGAAGSDPVGPAVRLLREQSGSLARFLQTIGKMTSFQSLLEAVIVPEELTTGQ